MARPNRNGVGSDTDHELYSFFSGGYAAELGLKSSTGSQLDRLSFKLGASSVRQPDGYNDHVKIAQQGPGGYLDVTKVGRALVKLCEPQVSREHEDPDPDWPHYFHVLKAFYTQRPHGAYEGLLDFNEYAGVALVVPEAVALTREYCEERVRAELAQNAAAVAKSRQEHLEQLGMLHGRLRVVLASSDPARHLRAYHLRRRIAAAEQPRTEQDVEANILRKWTQPGEQHALEALRQLCRATKAPKESGARTEARRQQAAILERARGIWRAARTAYVRMRREVDREIRATRKAIAQQDHDDFLATLELIPADRD